MGKTRAQSQKDEEQNASRAQIDRLEHENESLKRRCEEQLAECAKRLKFDQEREEELRELRDDLLVSEREIESRNRQINEITQSSQAALEKKREECAELEDQVFEYKKTIAEFTRLDRQVGDERFQRSFDRMYTGIKDCFMTIVYKNKNIKIKHIRPDTESRELLIDFVPNYKGDTPEDKLHVCIAIAGIVLTKFVIGGFVFGAPCNPLIRAATSVWNTIDEYEEPHSQKLKKQWLSITENLLNATGQDSKVEASERASKAVVDLIKDRLEDVTTIKVTAEIRESLSDAIAPCMEDLRSLHYQGWQFTLGMIGASSAGSSRAFDHRSMQGMFEETKGVVRASLFPVLRRMVIGEDGTNTGEKVVICKARVALRDPR